MEELNADNDVEEEDEDDDNEEVEEEEDVADNNDEGVAGTFEFDDGRDVTGASFLSLL